jgi:PAS domain S-box-containing protein
LVRDLTERKQVEDELRASETRFRILVDHASDAFFLYNEDGTVLDVNRQACDSLGYSRNELIGMTAFDYGPDLTPELLQRIRDRLQSGKIVSYDGRHRRKDGTVFPVEVRIRAHWHAGKMLAVSLDRDITERKRAEDELRASEERFRALVQFSFDVYWETDAEHRFIRQESGEGQPDADLLRAEIGKTRWEMPYLEPDADTWRKHREILDVHLPFRDFELARPTADGGRFYASVSGLPVFDKTGRFIGYRGVGRNITERKKAEERLRRSEAYLAEAQRLSNAGAFAFDEEGSLYWSEGTFRLWGFDPKKGIPSPEAIGQRIHPDDRVRTRRQLDEALRQRLDYTVEYRVVLPDGTLKHFRSIGHPSKGADGKPQVVGTTIDITERRRAQEERERLRQLEIDLAHMNRLSIMGELTASLAHEILHPIATARNNARAGMRFLEMIPPNLTEVREALACVVRDTDRGKDIVGRIRDHIKKAPPREESIDLNEAIDEVIIMVRNATDRNNVSVRTILMEQMACVRGDRVQLQQVVLNLILNALEAMTSVGEGERKLMISTGSQGSAIVVAVRDTGPGVDPEHFDQIFKPFYTTKASGIGMGLSICRSIIDAHGGQLWAEANQPKGIVFRFTLPSAS